MGADGENARADNGNYDDENRQQYRAAAKQANKNIGIHDLSLWVIVFTSPRVGARRR